jgi:hypothetical protein
VKGAPLPFLTTSGSYNNCFLLFFIMLAVSYFPLVACHFCLCKMSMLLEKITSSFLLPDVLLCNSLWILLPVAIGIFVF